MARLGSVKWTGLDSFKRELEVLTANLTSEAEGILLESAFSAADEIRAAYPYVEGGLQRGIVVVPARGLTLAGAELQQRAPHGLLYERGTKVRETSRHANRGRMQGRPTFEPIAAAYHVTAMSSIHFRLYQHGASRVTGEP